MKFQWPLVGKITSRFGNRVNPITGEKTSYHNGIDISAVPGTQVRAVAAGKVLKAWDDRIYGGGYSIVLQHEKGWTSGYCHLSEFKVKAGDAITSGQVIALSGGAKGMAGAGWSTGGHLHLTLALNGQAVDPMPHLLAEDEAKP